MEANDLLYLVLLVVTVGLIIFGALIPAVSFLIGVGIVLTAVFIVMWAVRIVKRKRHAHA